MAGCNKALFGTQQYIYCKTLKTFYDKVFMRMNPMQRRITLLIILLQAAMLITTTKVVFTDNYSLC